MCGSGGSSSSENKPEGEEDGGGDGDVSSKATVEAVLFSEAAEQNLLVTGSLEGVVNVWDISSQVRAFFHNFCALLKHFSRHTCFFK